MTICAGDGDMVRMKRVKMLSDSDIIASGDQYYDHREHIGYDGDCDYPISDICDDSYKSTIVEFDE